MSPSSRSCTWMTPTSWWWSGCSRCRTPLLPGSPTSRLCPLDTVLARSLQPRCRSRALWSGTCVLEAARQPLQITVRVTKKSVCGQRLNGSEPVPHSNSRRLLARTLEAFAVAPEAGGAIAARTGPRLVVVRSRLAHDARRLVSVRLKGASRAVATLVHP